MSQSEPKTKRLQFKFIWPITIVAFVIELVLLTIKEMRNPVTDELSSFFGFLFIITGAIGVVSFILWLKWFIPHMNFKKLLTKRLIIIVTPLVFIYLSLFFYGREAIKPRNNALNLVYKADSIVLSATQSASLKEDVSKLKEAINLYEQANEIDLNGNPIFGGYPVLKGYIGARHGMLKDALAYEETLLNETKPFDKTSHDNKIKELSSLADTIMNTYWAYNRTHTWMKLIFLQ